MAGEAGGTFSVELLRPDDLLHLFVDGDNLHVVTDAVHGAVLNVQDPERPAFLRFTFAPQTIAESALFEATLVKGQNDTTAQTPPVTETTVETPPTPGTASAVTLNVAKEPSVAEIGSPSRLVFVVPADAVIPFSLEGLLEWTNLELKVNGIAAIGVEASPGEIANAPAIGPPAANETALELPYRLVISPTSDAAWLHRRTPFTSSGRTELWHTRLALKSGAGITELSKTTRAPLRAIWSPDYDPNGLPQVQPDPNLGRTALTGRDRHQIVVLTSAFAGFESETGLRRERRPIGFVEPYVPLPFLTDRLMLSTLGGWLRSRGQWTPPKRAKPIALHRPDFNKIFTAIERVPAIPALEANRAIVDSAAESQSLDLLEWVHDATQGRDQYVKTVTEGKLAHPGHPAAHITITERKFEEHDGVVGAYLVKQEFVVVRIPVATFDAGDRGNPHKSVRLTTLVTPALAEPEYVTTTKGTFWVKVATGPGTSDYFRFHAAAIDVEGNPADFTVPLLFVAKDDFDNSAVAEEYNKPANTFRACQLSGQKVAFAAHDPAKPTDTTTLVTHSMTFMMQGTPTAPSLLKAAVKIPQVQELLGTDQLTSIRLFQDYVTHGADDAANKTGVFAEIVDDTTYRALVPDTNATVGLAIAAEKAGGMATPNMGITTLSRALGPLAGKASDAKTNTFAPDQYFPKGSAMLFGSFDLLELFLPTGSAAPSLMTLDENAPKMRTEKRSVPGGGQANVTTLDWKPKFLEPSGKFDAGVVTIEKNAAGETSVLEITGTITKPMTPGASASPSAGAATSEFSGSLNAFRVTILASLTIEFKSFSFRKASNEKAQVAVQLNPANPLTFQGELKFIEEIRSAIPPGLFGDGPSLDLIDDPLGIRAGFAFALPPITVAVFTLKDVKLGAALTLPFLDGKPVFDFNVSERAHPFLLAVAIFGGGGFFHLQLDTAGMKALEVSLEFGATAALDIGVASGEVHIMAGIYFSLQRKEGGDGSLAAILSGYLRLGGSLNVLGLISISVEFNLSFTYDGVKDKAYGRATLTVSVSVLMFSTSIELTVERAFGGHNDPHFKDFFPDPQPWADYALAFA